MCLLCSGVALHAINLYLATTVMPSIVREIGGIDFYAWNTSLFVVGSILGAALASQLLRRAGCRIAYLLAASAFALGCVVCAISSTMPMFVAGRLVQGLGGGLLLSVPYAVIQLRFGPTMWPRAMALLSAMWGVATLLGPALGGVLAELGIWRTAFTSLAVAALLCAAAAWPLLPARADALVRMSPWLSSIGLLTLLLLLPPGSGGDWPRLAAIAAALIVIGCAVGIAWPHLATRVLQRAARDEADLAAGSIMTIQLVGTALSAALAGIIVNAAGMSEAGGSGSAAFWLFAAILLAPVWVLLTGAAQRSTSTISA